MLFFFFLITYQIVKNSDITGWQEHREVAFTCIVIDSWMNTTSVEDNLFIPIIKIKVYIPLTQLLYL